VTGPNTLYYGDNLDVMRRHVGDATVDLVYLDPPFNSDVNYNVLFQEHGEKAAAQIEAFSDTWEWNTEAAAAYQDVVERETPPEADSERGMVVSRLGFEPRTRGSRVSAGGVHRCFGAPSCPWRARSPCMGSTPSDGSPPPWLSTWLSPTAGRRHRS